MNDFIVEGGGRVELVRQSLEYVWNIGYIFFESEKYIPTNVQCTL